MFNGLIGALRIDLGMNSAQLKKGADDATLRMRGLQKDMNRVARDLGKVGGRMSLALTLPLVAIGKQAMALQETQAEAVAQVDAALASMGTAAGYTSAELQKMASELQGSSLFGDEEILGKVTSNLLTFGNISGDVFARTQAMALDMSAALGQDLQGATVMLGKALNDPVKGLTALTRVGVSFTEEQKKLIKAMVEVGDAAGAQEMILAELERQYGGQAQALRDLPSGQIKAAMMDIGDAMEQVGAIVLPVFARIAGHVSELALAFQGLSPEVKRFAVIGAAVAAALGPALVAVAGLTSAVPTLLPVIVAIASPIGLTVAGFAALAAGAVYIGIKLKGVIDRLGGFGEAMGLARDVAAEAFERMGDAGQILKNKMSITFSTIQSGFTKMVLALRRIWADFLGTVAGGLEHVPLMGDAFDAVSAAAQSAAASVGDTEAALQEVQEGIAGLREDNASLAAGLKAPLASMKALRRAMTQTFEEGEVSAEGAQDATKGVTAALEDTGEAVDDLERDLDSLGGTGARRMKQLKDATKEVDATAQQLGRSFQGALAQLGSGNAAGALSSLASGLAQSAGNSFSSLITGAFSSGGAGIAGVFGDLASSFSGVTSALSGIASGGLLAGIGGAISAAMPIIGAITAVASLIGSFSSKKLLGSGIQLGVEDGGLLAGSYETIKKSTFWGLFSSTSTNVKALDEELQAALEKQLGVVQDSVRDTFAAAGLDVSEAMVDGVEYGLQKIDARDMSEAELQQHITAWFQGYADAISEAVADLSFEQVQILASLKTALEPMGQSFIGTIQEMAEAAESLTEIAGGMDVLSSQLSSFLATFYSDAERLDMASDALDSAFADLGLAVPTTAKAFRELVMGQDLMTESGRETYAALLSLSDLFAQVEGGISDLTGAFDLGSYYASEFDARLAAVAEARGYSAELLAQGDAGVTFASAVRQLSDGDVAQTSALRRLVALWEQWDAYGTPTAREF